MSNVEKIRSILSEVGTDAMLITSGVNRRAATGFPSSAGAAVVTADGAWFFTDSRYIEAATARIDGYTVLPVGRARQYQALISEVLGKAGAKTVAFEDARMTIGEYNVWKSGLGGYELVPLGSKLELARGSKTDEEIELMIKSQRISEKALEEVLPKIKPGVTEKEIAAELVYRQLLNGAENVSFDPIVVSGKNSSMPHGVPSDKKIEDGDFITMDFGSKYHGYCSDMTRTVAVGHVTPEMEKVYNIVLEAQLAGIAASRAGVPGEDIDAAARKVIENAGYGEYFGHSYGHSLGLEIHEGPNAAPGVKTPMPLNAVVSAEPGIYIPGQFGVRIEDVVIMRENCGEDIMKAPKELIIL